MKIVRITKDNLMEVVQKNASAHQEELVTARIGWRQQFQTELQKQLDALAAGQEPKTVHLAPPADHTKDYARVIGMIGMSNDTVLELDQHEFNRYVLDEWEWAHDKLLNSTYAMRASL